MTIEEKNNIVYVDHRRYYSLDLTKEYNNLEHSIPELFKYKDIVISSHAWGDMTVQIVEEFNKINSKTTEELLSVQYPFSDKYEVFSREQKCNYKECLGLYVCTNLGANRYLSAIKTLLTFYGVDLKDVYFLLNRHPVAESKECRDYFRTLTIDHMKMYFASVRKFKIGKIDTIINNLFALNRDLEKVSDSFNDLFLFDDTTSCNRICNDLLKYKDKMKRSMYEYNVVRTTLEFVKDYYKYRNKNPLY